MRYLTYIFLTGLMLLVVGCGLSESVTVEIDIQKEINMEALAVMGFVFGMVGVVALVRLEKLTKTLKEKGILEENYKEE